MISGDFELEDRHAICDLLSRYCHAMDAARADLCIGLFADNASMHTPVGEAVGRGAILAWIEQRLALRSPEYQVAHYLLNPLLTVITPTKVRVRSMLLYTRQRVDETGTTELLSTGIYEDEVQKTAKGWQFYSRRYSLSMPLDDAYFSPWRSRLAIKYPRDPDADL